MERDTFRGYFIYQGNVLEFSGNTLSNADKAAKSLHKYIKYDTYKTTPNSREEIKAYRDENTRNLHRVPASGQKTSISFTVRELHMTDKKALQNWFKTNTDYVNKERKVKLTYWNEEDNIYKCSYFYEPDIEFKIKEIKGTDVLYNEFEISLVEY